MFRYFRNAYLEFKLGFKTGCLRRRIFQLLCEVEEIRRRRGDNIDSLDLAIIDSKYNLIRNIELEIGSRIENHLALLKK